MNKQKIVGNTSIILTVILFFLILFNKAINFNILMALFIATISGGLILAALTLIMEKYIEEPKVTE